MVDRYNSRRFHVRIRARNPSRLPLAPGQFIHRGCNRRGCSQLDMCVMIETNKLCNIFAVFKSVWPSVCLHVKIGAISLLLNKYYTRRSGNMSRSPRKHRHMNTGITLKRWLLCRRPPPNFGPSQRIYKNTIVRIYFWARGGCLPSSFCRLGKSGVPHHVFGRRSVGGRARGAIGGRMGYFGETW